MFHSRGALDSELATLNDNILKLGSLAEEAVDKAMNALASRNLGAAEAVIVGDDQINRLRYEIEEESLRILATQSPAASDLRHVLAAMHIATELERIGDHAAGIAALVHRIDGEPDIRTLHQLPKMARRALKMIRKSLQAFIEQDSDMAANVIERDEKLDKQFGRFSDLMIAELSSTETGTNVIIPTYLLWMAHNLERIGDRVTNIAERVIFMVTGEFVELD